MIRYRHEKKYLVPIEKIDALRSRFAPFLIPDIFSETKTIHPEYVVRSIYFDTHQTVSYFEKIEGLRDRKKFRIRGYGSDAMNAKVVLEIKRKVEDRVTKNRAFLDFTKAQQLLKDGDLSKVFDNSLKKDAEDASRFMFNIKRYNLAPKTLIVYQREAYHGRFDSGVRVTFDKNIKHKDNPKVEGLFSNFGLKKMWRGNFILEVKYFDGEMPSWAKSIIQEFSLRNDALSKYARGIESSFL